ncbi:MAG TPA: ankyrin repeat domain-containing protein [Accumulibacter sp.]|uniref:ankyrin repeat domain-containing protein n=1 Tax=Accumulibacter sp. TaxID=2053492 RepID=UPI0025EFDBA7|nr:ankyrin repeat domain-containing protein [Accumulibacter sp.]MCM8597464.1 ankyrin repeat domain-containing protein [Accumulibacter sp.]MCM8661752.1 ankyrin repeat domain-containing protein [Accumulibacter sp.]HNC52900.1 ankyrin repeat domain-containing protein [Accumulibacter sp.]
MDKIQRAPTEHEEQIRTFVATACAGDLDTMRAQVTGGFDLNGTDRFGDTILERVISDLEHCPAAPKHAIVREMLRLGADPRRLGRDGCGPLLSAVLNMDVEMLRILLDAGADPNAVRIWSTGELLYDWADFVYRYEVWNAKLPQEAAAVDRANPDAWLRYLDRLAVSYGKRRPDHLRLLRERGAFSSIEFRSGSYAAAA